ncbi:sugar phosphate isomerase/epimerase family protein [Lactiplantibacillus plantarum]|uniref:sugar phosphate isomerase/epimerase family protein n=1 Tax=Lactiplantibacillus plantarum TaxID=1590 RepID=UPI0010818459|nr:sugar phosphate isomerase/epimerase [Lactiplantibacillus plantarum]QBX92981.1 sugar phosphate isomerase/epimerase [Lactiplantibacillus plantarum]
MKIGINTAIYESQVQAGATQLECLKTLVTRFDVSAVEVRGEFFKPETRSAELLAISQLCEEQHWDLYYSVPEELFSSDGYNASLVTNLELATKYHIKSLKYSFGVQPTLQAHDLEALTQLLATTPIQVTIENQPNANGDLATFESDVAWVKSQKLSLGYTFDSGNWYWIDQQPEPAFAALKSAITVFHLKDIKDQTTVMLGQGATDWHSLLGQLSPEIPVFLEYNIAAADLSGQIDWVKQALS